MLHRYQWSQPAGSVNYESSHPLRETQLFTYYYSHGLFNGIIDFFATENENKKKNSKQKWTKLLGLLISSLLGFDRNGCSNDNMPIDLFCNFISILIEFGFVWNQIKFLSFVQNQIEKKKRKWVSVKYWKVWLAVYSVNQNGWKERHHTGGYAYGILDFLDWAASWALVGNKFVWAFLHVLHPRILFNQFLFGFFILLFYFF